MLEALTRGGVGRYFDPAKNYETLESWQGVSFKDDFLGADIVIPASGSDESGCNWTKKIVGSGTVAGVANETNGVVAAALTSASEAQSSILHMDDQLTIDPGQGLIFECRFKLTVLPTLVAEAVIGFGTAYGVPDSMATSAWITADGSGELFCESDNGSADASATSGITVTTADWVIARIDCIDEDDIKFYINGVGVATGTTFKTAGKAQPFIGLYKASGAGLGVIQIDCVKMWQNRA